jgi:hypothetical protein
MTAILILSLVVLAVAVCLFRIVQGDGYGTRNDGQLPRSHRPDMFEPTRWAR